MRRVVVRFLATFALGTVVAGLVTSEARGAGARSFKTGTIQITADGRYAWTANADNRSVSRISLAGYDVDEWSIPDCDARGVSVREDGAEAWVTCPALDSVVVLSGADGSELARIAFPHGSAPAFVALSPDQSLALVTLHRGDAIGVVGAESKTLGAVLPCRRAPLGAAWSRDGRFACVTHAFSDGERTFVTRVDALPSPHVGACVPIGVQRPTQSTRQGFGHIDYAEGGAVTLRGHLAQIPAASGDDSFWLPAQHNGTTDAIPTMDTTVQAAIHKLDPRSAEVDPSRRIVLTAPDVHDPEGLADWVRPGWNAHVAGLVDIAFSADGSTAWLLGENSQDILVVPTDTGASRPQIGARDLREIEVEAQPTGIVISPTAQVALVHESVDRSVVIINVDTESILARLVVTARTGMTPDNAITRGRRIFHTSALTEVCGNQKVACASCHWNGEHDGLIWHFETLATPIGPRPTTSMLGLSLTMAGRDAATGLGQLHRAGDRDEIADFEHTFRSEQMGGTGFFTVPPNPYGGAPNAGGSASIDAMSAYMTSLRAPARSPHRDAGGSLTAAARRGAAMFRGTGGRTADAGCITCHQPEHGFADLRFHDVGSARPAEERQIGARAPEWMVNTPTLVGIWTTAPYDDGGSLGEQRQYMSDVLESFARRAPGQAPHGNVAGLTRRQLRDLAELVLSIDAGMTAAEISGVADTQPPRLIRAEPVSLTRIDCWFDEAVAASAADPSMWSVTADDGTAVRVTAAERDATWGDKVVLTTEPLPRGCAGRVISVAPGRIADLAGDAASGRSNLLDVSDPRNVVSFALGDTITVTLGASGAENVPVVVHDAAIAGPAEPDASLDEAWIRRLAGAVSSSGFVRFEWEDAFIAATSVTDPSLIEAASVTLQPEWGASQTILARRMLQAWSDAREGDAGGALPGPPTWREHGRGLGAWNAPGGLARGGTGNIASDYFGAFDVAGAPDAVATVASLGDPVVLSGAGITSAYRFWLGRPDLDMGHAVELADGTPRELRFARSGEDFGRQGPRLVVTYRLPPAPRPAAEVSSAASGVPLLASRSSNAVTLSFEDEGAGSDHEVFEGALGDFASHAGAGCAATATAPGGRLVTSLVPAAGNRYFLVGASSPCGGDLGTDGLGRSRPIRFSACAP